MKNLLHHPDIVCTDPDQLQFCLKISDTEFWYCEPNWYNDKLMPDSGTKESDIVEKYTGYPKALLDDAKTDNDLRAFLGNRQLWLHGSSEIKDFSQEEQEELLSGYGYSWSSFPSDAERNQMICENYFEQNPMEFRYDI